jgi:hypothetical protein
MQITYQTWGILPGCAARGHIRGPNKTTTHANITTNLGHSARLSRQSTHQGP